MDNGHGVFVPSMLTGCAGEDTMMSVTTVYARGPVSIEEYEALPDDGNRYELIDGTVYMTPSPGGAHQVAITALQLVLTAAAPHDLAILPTYGYRAGERTLFIPDLVVCPWPDRTSKWAAGSLSLVVEALSPSTRRHDRVRKLAGYERAGVEAYWILDPGEPSLLVFEREGERLVERAHVRGDEPFAATRPFDVTVVPSATVARLR